MYIVLLYLKFALILLLLVTDEFQLAIYVIKVSTISFMVSAFDVTLGFSATGIFKYSSVFSSGAFIVSFAFTLTLITLLELNLVWDGDVT